MTQLAVYLEDFGSVVPAADAFAQAEEALETERLEAFDKGYRAGWDDAIAAKADDKEQLSTELSQNLQDLSFTYHEAHAQVLSNLAPLFDEIFQKLLPGIARDTLASHIVDQLSHVARDIAAVSVEIAVAPGSAKNVMSVIEGASPSLPVSVRESDTLGDGQAELRLGGREMAVDLAGVTEQIKQAVQAVLYQETSLSAHG